MFHKVVWQHMQGVTGFLINFYCKFTKESFSVQYFENRLRFERIMAMSLWPRFLAHPVYMTVHVDTKQFECISANNVRYATTHIQHGYRY